MKLTDKRLKKMVLQEWNKGKDDESVYGEDGAGSKTITITPDEIIALKAAITELIEAKRWTDIHSQRQKIKMNKSLRSLYSKV